jgi:hypothetical protein
MNTKAFISLVGGFVILLWLFKGLEDLLTNSL